MSLPTNFSQDSRSCPSDSPGVLKEIDCFISKGLRKQLLLLLYKNRNAARPLEAEQIKEGRIKSSLDLLELHIRDGKIASYDETANQPDSYLLRSAIQKLPTTLLGYFVNDECHFMPLERDALVMDTAKELIKEKSRVAETPDGNAPQSGTSSVVVTARLKINEGNPFRSQMGARRKPTENDPDVLFLNQQSLIPWRPIRYIRFVPSDAFENRIPLLYPYEDSEFIDQSGSGPRQEEYTESLLAALRPSQKSSNRGRTEPAQPQSLEELIQAIMMKAHVIRFSKLVVCARERFSDPHQVTNTLVLQHVQKVAVLVRGWWVVKSELLYPPTTYSEHGSVSSTLLIRARDYIMAVFYRGEHLTRKTISSMTKLPALEATEILNSLARKMSSTQKGHANHWEFHPTDHDFVRRFPDVVQQQSAAWEMRIRQLCVQLKLEHLVSDGARRRRGFSGRLSSESGSEAEYDIPSLVSGVHVSGSGSKRTTPFRRRRQRSLSQTESSNLDGAMDSADKQPPRKRIRTQSLSVTAVNSMALGATTDQKATGEPIPRVSDVSEFSTPLSPPIRVAAATSAVPLTPVMKISSPPRTQTDPVPPMSPTAKIPLKAEPPGSPVHCASPPPLKTTIPSTEVNASGDSVVDSERHDVALPEASEMREAPVNGSPVDASRTALVNIIREMVRTRPIVGLTEVMKRIQQTIGSELLQAANVIPGSEAERELLKTWIMDALADADARQLNVPWPTVPSTLPQDILITAMVGGTECGAVSEMTQKLREVILDMFETESSIRVKDVQDRMNELTSVMLPRKAIYSMLKQYCVFRHNRYFLRLTVSE